MSDAARRIAVFIERIDAAPVPVVARAPKGKIAPKPVAPKRRPMQDEAPAKRKPQVELNHNAARLSPQQKQSWMKHTYQQQKEYLEQHPDSIFHKIGITRRAPKNTNDDAQADDNENRNGQGPQADGDQAGGEKGDGAENHDDKNDQAEVNNDGKEVGEPSPLDKETRPLTPEESEAAKGRVEQLSQDGALDANSPQREESAAVIEQDGAKLLQVNLPDSDKADIAQGIAETKAQAKGADGADADGKFGGFEFKYQQRKDVELQQRKQELEFERDNEEFMQRKREAERDEEGHKEKRDEDREIRKEDRQRQRELEDRDYKHGRKASRSQKKMRYALGALAIAGLLGVGIFAVSPGLAMGLGIHMMDHIGKLFAGSRDEDDDDNNGRRSSYAALRKLPDILLLAEEGNEDAIGELARLAADYVRRGQLPEDLLDNLRRQVKL